MRGRALRAGRRGRRGASAAGSARPTACSSLGAGTSPPRRAGRAKDAFAVVRMDPRRRPPGPGRRGARVRPRRRAARTPAASGRARPLERLVAERRATRWRRGSRGPCRRRRRDFAGRKDSVDGGMRQRDGTRRPTPLRSAGRPRRARVGYSGAAVSTGSPPYQRRRVGRDHHGADPGPVRPRRPPSSPKAVGPNSPTTAGLDVGAGGLLEAMSISPAARGRTNSPGLPPGCAARHSLEPRDRPRDAVPERRHRLPAEQLACLAHIGDVMRHLAEQ